MQVSGSLSNSLQWQFLLSFVSRIVFPDPSSNSFLSSTLCWDISITCLTFFPLVWSPSTVCCHSVQLCLSVGNNRGLVMQSQDASFSTMRKRFSYTFDVIACFLQNWIVSLWPLLLLNKSNWTGIPGEPLNGRNAKSLFFWNNRTHFGMRLDQSAVVGSRHGRCTVPRAYQQPSHQGPRKVGSQLLAEGTVGWKESPPQYHS